MMNKADETNFNKAADVPSAPNTSSASARQRRVQGKVLTYAEVDKLVHVYGADGKALYADAKNADGTLKDDGYGNAIQEKVRREDADPQMEAILKQMEGFMKALDDAPDSYDAVMGFGVAPIQELGAHAKQGLAIQQSFDAQVNVMRKAQEELTQSGLKEFVNGAQKALGAVRKAASKGAGKFGGMLGNLFGGKKDEKSEEKAYLEEMQNALPTMMKQMTQLAKGMQGSDQGIEQVLQQAAALGKERNKCARELSLYLGCKDEVLRRYEEIYIPEAQQMMLDDPESASVRAYHENVVKRQNQFRDRILNLLSQKALCDAGSVELQNVIHTMEEQRTQIKSLIETSMPQWDSMLNSMGFAASSLKVADMIKDGNDFSNEIFLKTQEMLETAHNMTKLAGDHGVVKLELIIEASQKFQQMIESNVVEQEKRAQMLDQQMKALDTANNNLLDAVNKAKGLDTTQALDSAAPSNDNSGTGGAVRPKRPGAGGAG